MSAIFIFSGNVFEPWPFIFMSNLTMKILKKIMSFAYVGNERTQGISYKIIHGSTKWVESIVGGQAKRAGVSQ
jgi:hypothetical protein